MEHFVVSARKYRPVTFESVVGQAHITTTLQNAIRNNQLAQALLFCGPRGVGKTTCARILARTVNQMDNAENPEMALGFNVYELDAASNNSVEDIRSLVEQVRYPPQQGKYKVYIIDEVHMLSNAAFNAFLKTLEEPPPYVIFILATTEKHKIIPTILSRCQIFDFNRIQITDIVNQLAMIAEREDIRYEMDALHLVAQKADGAMRDALSLFDMLVTFSADRSVTYHSAIENLHILDYDYYFRLVDALYQEDSALALVLFDEILRKGFDAHNFLVGMMEHLRNLLICKDASTLQLLEAAEGTKKRYQQQAKEVETAFLLSALNVCMQAEQQYKASKNQRLTIELSLLKMTYMRRAIQLADLDLEKKKAELNQPTPVQAGSAAPRQLVGPAAAPERRVQPIRELPSSPASVDAVKEKIRQEAQEKSGQQATTEARTRPFTSADVRAALDAYKASQDTPAIQHLLETASVQVSGMEVKIRVVSTLQMNQLDGIRQHLLACLKNALQNDGVLLLAEKTEQQSVAAESNLPSKPYTPSERFEFMARKNPALLLLKERLGLDLGA